MIYLVIGASCAGKSSFVKNSFLKGKTNKEYRDLIPITENEDCYLFGRFGVENRTVGTDRVSRKDIPNFFEQIKRLYNDGKDIVLEGDKICSHKLFQAIADSGMKCKLYWIRCSENESIRRNRINGSTCTDSYLKAVAKKAENIFYDFKDVFQGEIFDTENISDFSDFSLKTAVPFISDKKMRDDFAVFILSHGRADNLVTLKPLLAGGYTGKWYIVIDNEDKTADEYYKRYGDHVIMFDKLAKAREIDAGDNLSERRAIVYARHACFDIAESLGIEYFLELDDDYQSFCYRWAEGESLRGRGIKNLDRVFNAMIDFLEDTGALTVAFAQAGDFIGGVNGGKFSQGLLRKAMNTFFFKTKNRVNFMGKQNEDVSTYVRLGSVGHLFFTLTAIAIVQSQTQSLAGGMSELYKDNGTYLKSFYTIMYCPSSVKITMMGSKHFRIHHQVNWNCAVPKILSEKWKKYDE